MLCSFRVPAFYFPWSRSSQIVSYFLNKTKPCSLFCRVGTYLFAGIRFIGNNQTVPLLPQCRGGAEFFFDWFRADRKKLRVFPLFPPSAYMFLLTNGPSPKMWTVSFILYRWKQTKKKKKQIASNSIAAFFPLSLESINEIVEPSKFANNKMYIKCNNLCLC